jgi:hypothetical protein
MEKQVKFDIKGDKQLLFQGATYNYLRRIFLRSLNGMAMFMFINKKHEKFETII